MGEQLMERGLLRCLKILLFIIWFLWKMNVWDFLIIFKNSTKILRMKKIPLNISHIRRYIIRAVDFVVNCSKFSCITRKLCIYHFGPQISSL